MNGEMRRARLVGTVREEAEHQHDTLSWNDVSNRVIEWMRVDVEHVNWVSTYRVQHRAANHFRRGRAFLLGYAAHIQKPGWWTGHEHRHRRRGKSRLKSWVKADANGADADNFKPLTSMDWQIHGGPCGS